MAEAVRRPRRPRTGSEYRTRGTHANPSYRSTVTLYALDLPSLFIRDLNLLRVIHHYLKLLFALHDRAGDADFLVLVVFLRIVDLRGLEFLERHLAANHHRKVALRAIVGLGVEKRDLIAAAGGL